MFLTRDEINKIGFQSVGQNVFISDKAVFYYPERISIGNNVRIDDFCVLSGQIQFGNNIHIGVGSVIFSSHNFEGGGLQRSSLMIFAPYLLDVLFMQLLMIIVVQQ